MPPQTGQPINETIASLRRQWGGLAPGQRRTLALVAAGAVAALLLWAGLAAKGPTMAPLFTNLAPQDAAAILAQLQHGHTSYQLADNGQTILVPQAQVDALRIQMAGQGLPNQGNVGLSSVLNLPFGATDFTRQVAYQNALQGELAQTIDAISGVRSARVQIVMPQNPTLGGTASPASAAVLVQMQPGIALGPDQVAGIQHLVASSVQGLGPTGVTVLDQTGQILSNGTAGAGSSLSVGGAAAAAQDDLQVQQAFDRQLQQGLQSLLGQVFGPGNVVAQVQAQLNFSSGTVDKTFFSPAGAPKAVLASMQQLRQTSSGTTGGTSGAPAGTAANSVPYYGAAGGSGNNTSSSDQVTRNYDVSQETQTLSVAPGAVSRLSVAVVVNSRLSAAQAALIRQTVATAVGADVARRDQITVVGLPFNQALLTSLQSQPAAAQPVSAVPVRYLIPAAALAALLIAAAFLLPGRRNRVREVELDALDVRSSSGPLTAGALDVPAAPTEEDLRVGVESSLRDRPEDVARVIRAWLVEDE